MSRLFFRGKRRMKAHLLIPGVERGGEAADSGLKALGGGELFGKGAGDRGEE